MAANRLVIEALLKGEKGVKSGLKGIVTGLLSIAGAMKAIQVGARFVNAAADEFVAWEGAMANANRMLQIEEHQLDVLKQRLLAATGPLQNVANLHEQLPDAMYRMASAGEDEVHMFEDLQDIAALAGMAHEDLGETADNTMGIMRAFNMENGEANKVIRILVGAEQAAIAKSGELAAAIRELAPAFNVTGESAEVTAAAIAAVTKAGFSAKMAATALRMGWAKMGTDEVRRKLAALGVEVTDFVGTMEQIKEIEDEVDWVDILGIRQYAKFAGLIAHWDDFNDALEKTKTANVGDMFDAFAATASAAGNRIENEFNRRLIEIGERAEPARRELTMFANELKLAGTEMAAWALKNKNAIIAIAAGIVSAIITIKTAVRLSSGPIGWLIGAIELLVGLFIGLGDAFTKDTKEMLAYTREMQDLTAKSIAQVQTAQEQVEAELEAAAAREDGAQRAKELAGELENLRAKEQALIHLQSGLIQSTLQLEAALLAEGAAIEIGGGFDTGRKGEAWVKREMETWRARLDSAEKIREETQRLTDLQVDLATRVGDEAAQREMIVGYMADISGTGEDIASQNIEAKLDNEEIVEFLKAQSAALNNATGIMEDQERIRFQNLRYDYERLGILDQINALKNGTLDLEEEELKVLVSQLEVEIKRLWAMSGQLRAQWAWLKGLVEAGVASEKILGPIEKAMLTVSDYIEETEDNIDRIGSMFGRIIDRDEDEDEDTPGVKGAEDARNYWQGYEGVTQEELARARKRREDKEIESQRVKADAAIESNKEATKAIAAENVERMKSLAADLAGVFRGAFTDESWSFWDSFESLGLRTLDTLLQYAIMSGLFSLMDLGDVAKPGGLAGGILDLLGFAEGGYVTKPTLATVGETHPEWIIPRADMLAAMAGGMGAVENLLSRLSGQTVTGPAPSGAQVAGGATTITTVHQHYAPAIGSLDKLDEYSQQASTGPTDY